MTMYADRAQGLLPRSVARQMIGYATLAPSVHNTQPWRWRISDDGIELYADPTRRLPVEDPVGRNLVISCGAALHHLQVAATALGWSPRVERVAGTSDPTLLARVSFERTGRRDDDALATLQQRRTDRRRFTSWPIPDERLRHLADEAELWGCQAVPLLDETSRTRLALLARTARAAAAADDARSAEQRRWVDRSDSDGVPSPLVPADDDPLRNRFGGGSLTDGFAELESTDGVVVLGGTTDFPSAWLRTGEGLSALWLKATEGDLSVVPLSQPIEVEHTRVRLRQEVLRRLVIPHLVVRVGWQAIGRSDLPPSPRRPVEDVLIR